MLRVNRKIKKKKKITEEKTDLFLLLSHCMQRDPIHFNRINGEKGDKNNIKRVE